MAPTMSGGKSARNVNKNIRQPVLALRRAVDKNAARAIVAQLKSALLEAEVDDVAVDGQLIGMAAAQAVRLDLPELVEILCAFVRSRLSTFGGREVAELVAAAVKVDCDDLRFLRCTATFCHESASAFRCLRDVSLVAASLSKKAQHVDIALAFYGLSVAASFHLQHKCTPRDVIEFLSPLAQHLASKPQTGGMPLYETPLVQAAICLSLNAAKQELHNASSQDVAKISGALASMWALMPHFQDSVFRPCLQDVTQAVRFHCKSFNPQDIALTVTAFAKMSVADQLIVSLLREQIDQRLTKFSHKDLCLVMWASVRLGWNSDEQWGKLIVAEVQKRDLTAFSRQDLTMAAQCLAKIGSVAKAPLCLITDEAFNRQLSRFTASDQACFLWCMAKSKVLHLALCRVIVRSLAVEGCTGLPRAVASAALWALGSVLTPLQVADSWARRLIMDLCSMAPWVQASAYEVANAAWAFTQFPAGYVPVESWSSLAETAEELEVSELTLHELCKLVSAFMFCRDILPDISDKYVDIFGLQICTRLDQGGVLSAHDVNVLQVALSHVDLDSASVEEQPTSVVGRLVAAFKKQQNNLVSNELGNAVGGGDRTLIVPDAEWLQVAEEPNPVRSGRPEVTAGKRTSHTFDESSVVAPPFHPPPRVQAIADKARESNKSERAKVSDPPQHRLQEKSVATLSLQSNKADLGPDFGGDGSDCEELVDTFDVFDLCEERTQAEGSPTRKGVVTETVGKRQHDNQGWRTHASAPAESLPYTRLRGHQDADNHSSLHAHQHEEFDEETSSKAIKMTGFKVCEDHGQPHGHSSHEHAHVHSHHHEMSDPEITGEMACCPAVGMFDGADSSGQMRLNTHCNYQGHCVQLKNTFIHVECSAVSDEEDCFLCQSLRRRSRSVDNIDASRKSDARGKKSSGSQGSQETPHDQQDDDEDFPTVCPIVPEVSQDVFEPEDFEPDESVPEPPVPVSKQAWMKWQ